MFRYFPSVVTYMNTAIGGITAAAVLLAACQPSNSERGDAGASELIGTWQRARADGTIRDQYVFRPDGSLTFDENKPEDPASEDHVTGTYTASSDTLVATGTNAKDGTSTQMTVTYYAGKTSFATQALRPVGTHTGAVGLWAVTLITAFPDEPGRAAEGSTATYELRGDGTYTAVSQSPDGGMSTQEGTFREVTPGFFEIVATGQLAGSSLQMIDDAALVFPTRIFQRK